VRMTAVCLTTLFLLGVLSLIAGTLPRFSGDVRRFLRACGCVLLTSLVLEGVVFNYDALTTRQLTREPLDMTRALVTQEKLPAKETLLTAVTPSGQEAAPSYRTTVVFENLSAACETVQLGFVGENQILDAQIFVQDAAYSAGYALANTVKLAPGSEHYASRTARVQGHGALTGLKIVFETQDASAQLEFVALNAPIAYRFSLLRCLSLLLPALLLCAVVSFRWWQTILSRPKLRHRLIYTATALVCVLLTLWVHALCIPYDPSPFPYTRALEYPFENGVYPYRSLTHAVMFDTLMKGQMHVDVPVDEALLAMENPYDATARMAAGAEYLFDYALYDGQYYAYFGLTPVLVFYLPHYVLTGYLPSYTTAALWFAALTVIAAFLCVWETSRRFVKKPSLLLLCLSGAAVVLGSHVLMLQSCADRYHLSIQSMQLFFYLTVYTALRATCTKTRAKRTVLYMVCALCTFLLVWSRATGALAAAGIVAPLFVSVLVDKRILRRHKMIDALAYLIPLTMFAGVVMAYNYARFDSPLEFGQTFQITTEDIRQNALSLRDTLKAIWYYFFDGLETVAEFPYLTVGSHYVNRTGNYFYGVMNAGAFTVPLTLCCFLLPFVPEKRYRCKMLTYVCALAVCVIIAVSSFSVAGVAQRYVCDILPVLCLVGAAVMLDVTAIETQEKRGALVFIAGGVCAATICVALCLTFSNYRCFISQYAPDQYLRLYHLFTLH